jgi:hypothetical protein
MKNYLWKYLLPGLVLIGCAFWAGTLQNLIFALVGFISFFVIGVTLIIEGWKQTKDSRPQTTGKAS